MSPICSTMVARERGTMVNTADHSSAVSTSPENRPNKVLFQLTGTPIHAAFATAVETASRSAGSTISAKM